MDIQMVEGIQVQTYLEVFVQHHEQIGLHTGVGVPLVYRSQIPTVE